MKNKIFLLLLIFSSSMISVAQTITFDKSMLSGKATQIFQTDDGGYLLYSPTSNSNSTLNDITFIKTDQYGYSELIKSYSDLSYPARRINKTLDGGYVSAASKMNGLLEDSYLMKFDQNLDTVWTKTFGNPGLQEFGHSIIQLPDSSFIFASRDAGQIYLRKLNKDGGLIWYKKVGSLNSGGIFGSLQSVLLNLSDGTFFLFAPINNSSLIRMNADADTIWIKTNINVRNCFLTNDGFVLLSTTTNLQKLDLDGNLIWQKDIAVVRSFTQSSNGNYILLKDGNNILETDTSGNILSSTPITDYSGEYIASTPDGGFIVGGSTDNYAQYNGTYVWFRKTDNNLNYSAINLRLPADADRIKIFETYPIKWITNSADYINLDYSTDNQVSWNSIIHFYPADFNTFNWALPEMPSGNLFIRISDSFNPDLYDRSDPPQKAVNYHSLDYIAANEIFMKLSNDGMNAHNPVSGTNGFLWPGGMQATIGAIFQDGLVWGGKVNGEIRVNGNTYRAGLQPGYILPNGMPSDPLDVKSKMFKLKKNWQFLPPGPERSRYEFDYLNWPVDLGAPWDDNNNDGIYTLGIDNPRILGEETLFFVANDLDTSRSTFTYGSNPIGLELQVTTFGYNSELLKDVVFKKFKIINKSGNDITDMYLSYWADVDLGYAMDDLTCFDSTYNMSYVYNGDNNDEFGYGTPPPALAHMIVQSPIIPGTSLDSARFDEAWRKGFKNIGMTSSGLIVKSSTIYPDDVPLGIYAGTLEFYNVMQGLKNSGDSIINPLTNQTTIWPLTGDPVTGTGWYTLGPPGDQRYHLPSGSFNMAIGDTQEVVIAFLIKKGTDNINSVAVLKDYAAQIQNWYDNDFVTDVEETIPSIPIEFSLSQNYPNPFNPSTTIKYAISLKQLVQLKVYDILGSEVATLVNQEQSPGNYNVDFNASRLSSGVYFYQLKAGEFIQTKKMIFIK